MSTSSLAVQSNTKGDAQGHEAEIAKHQSSGVGLPAAGSPQPQYMNKTEHIMRTIALQHGISVEELRKHRNSVRLVKPRAMAIYLLRECTYLSYPQIARIVGGFDHSTMIYHRERTRYRMLEDAEFRERMERLAHYFGRVQ